jgi:hypothetical protein
MPDAGTTVTMRLPDDVREPAVATA